MDVKGKVNMHLKTLSTLSARDYDIVEEEEKENEDTSAEITQKENIESLKVKSSKSYISLNASMQSPR